MRHVLNIILLVLLVACGPEPTSNDITRDKQETGIKEGIAQVGLPAIKNFRELKIMRDIYEMRDQTGLITYTYVWSEMLGKGTFFCNSIGYPLPYATQMSAPESVQSYVLPEKVNESKQWGHEKLPQPEPNGLFIPDSADATWVMCIPPGGGDARPVYSEPKLVAFQWKLPCDMLITGCLLEANKPLVQPPPK